MEVVNGSTLDPRGREIFDQTPVAVGIPFERPIPLHIKIRNQILQMMNEQSEEEETFQDAEDFNVEDDDTLQTPYEYEEDFDHLMSSFGDQPGGAGGTPPSTGQSNENEANTDSDQKASE